MVKAKREDTMKRTWRTLSKTDGYQPISDEAVAQAIIAADAIGRDYKEKKQNK